MTTTIEVSGGDEALKALEKIAEKLGKTGEVEVGFLATARYPDKAQTYVATVAAAQEFGTIATGGHIPSRPFFRNMIAKYSPGWADEFVAIAKGQHYDVMKSLDAIGENIEGQLRKSIDETNSPPLSPVTIAKKGFSKPLIDTGVMKRLVSHRVKT